MKDRLIELIREAELAHLEDTIMRPHTVSSNDFLADYLLENGVIVPPCKVGQTVYALWNIPTEAKYVIYCAEVKEIRITKKNNRLATIYRLEPVAYRGRVREYYDSEFGELVFINEEEAEAKLKEGADNDHK